MIECFNVPVSVSSAAHSETGRNRNANALCLMGWTPRNRAVRRCQLTECHRRVKFTAARRTAICGLRRRFGSRSFASEVSVSSSSIESPAVKLSPRSSLFPYQEQAVKLIVERRQLGVFLKMGLGKTAIALTESPVSWASHPVTAPPATARPYQVVMSNSG